MLITSLSPSGGERMSKHTVPGGDICALLARFSELQRKALARTGTLFPVIVVQEAGLDGFWIYRLLEKEGIESHVVDAASIAVARRRRRKRRENPHNPHRGFQFKAPTSRKKPPPPSQEITNEHHKNAPLTTRR